MNTQFKEQPPFFLVHVVVTTKMRSVLLSCSSRFGSIIDGFQSTGFYKLNCNFFSCLFNTFFSVGCCLLHFRTIRRLIQKILLHKCHHISDWIPLLSQIFETCATGERMSERRKNCMQKSI